MYVELYVGKMSLHKYYVGCLTFTSLWLSKYLRRYSSPYEKNLILICSFDSRFTYKVLTLRFFQQKVRTYKERRYIMDSGGHVSGNKGIAAYINNNNLYFTLAMSTPDDTLRWTVRTSIFTVR